MCKSKQVVYSISKLALFINAGQDSTWLCNDLLVI